jgi:hypothetical protein
MIYYAKIVTVGGCVIGMYIWVMIKLCQFLAKITEPWDEPPTK